MRNEGDYTRVTEALYKFSGMEKIKRMFPDVLDNARERGNRIDKICKLLIQESIEKSVVSAYFADPAFPADEAYIESFREWYFNKIFIPTPPRLFCDELMLSGEPDAIYEDDRGLGILDIKATSGTSHTWLLQGSAYSYLAKKAGYDIQFIEFIRLKNTGKKPQVIVYEENFPLYKSHLDAYRYSFKGRDKDEEDIFPSYL